MSRSLASSQWKDIQLTHNMRGNIRVHDQDESNLLRHDLTPSASAGKIHEAHWDRHLKTQVNDSILTVHSLTASWPITKGCSFHLHRLTTPRPITKGHSLYLHSLTTSCPITKGHSFHPTLLGPSAGQAVCACTESFSLPLFLNPRYPNMTHIELKELGQVTLGLYTL